MLLVLDAMRRDYFDRYADSLPTLSGLRRRGAWFARARMNVLPSNTAVAHPTIATGADPRVHGVSAAQVYDQRQRRRMDLPAGRSPRDLMALTLSDVWQMETSGRAVIVAQGAADRAAIPLAGHGACQPNGVPVVMVTYDVPTGAWGSNPDCYRLPGYLAERNARTLWAAGPAWMGHRIDSSDAVRYSAPFAGFEADAMIAMIEREPLGQDSVPDLILMNYKTSDYVGHAYGPDSPELRATLAAMDRHLARILAALEARVGTDYLLAITADHGMPSEPPSPDRRHYTADIIAFLHQRFDPEGRLITLFEPENGQLFVDESRLATLGVSLGDMARFLESQSWVFAAFSRDEVRRAAAEPR
jgi:hypothetical protein